jgi:hypothetical protein
MSSKEILENKGAPTWLKESIEKADYIRSEIENNVRLYICNT